METGNKYKYSKAYFKILNLIVSNPKETIFVIRGGQGASKTVSIIELIVQSLLSSEKEASILSSELSKMKRTVIRDYKKIVKDWGVLRNDTDFNKSESKHEYENGSYLDFLGADVNDVGKGFRRDILYINEADKMDIDTAVQFISRARLTIIDYNPDALFWGDEYINENNFISLTYEDNEYLSESERLSILDYKTKGFHNPDLEYTQLFEDSNIKSAYWANKWRVYGLGLVGALDGVVFDNWKQVDSVPADAKLLGYGMDFGYTTDPTALVGVYIMDNELYFNELIYQTKLNNNEIGERLKALNIVRPHEIVCDSAEPKSIAELRLQGFNTQPAQKGPDSIKAGIDILKRYNLNVTKGSIHLIAELLSYAWDKDKDGKLTGKPVDHSNHAIDAIRYFALNKLNNRPRGKYTLMNV